MSVICSSSSFTLLFFFLIWLNKHVLAVVIRHSQKNKTTESWSQSSAQGTTDRQAEPKQKCRVGTMQMSASCAQWLQIAPPNEVPLLFSAHFQRQYLIAVFLLGTVLLHLGVSSVQCFLKTVRGIKGKEGRWKQISPWTVFPLSFFH